MDLKGMHVSCDRAWLGRWVLVSCVLAALCKIAMRKSLGVVEL
jgi:hypothetical protein